MGVLAELVDAGKVRFCGVSNFSVRQLQQAQKALGKHPIVSNQVRYNLIDRTIERDLLPYCQLNQITVIAYSPLAAGLQRVAECDPSSTVLELARTLGKSPAQNPFGVSLALWEPSLSLLKCWVLIRTKIRPA